MKKVVFVAAMLLAFVGAKAQTNIQEMYDFKRGHLTTTLEMFKSDAFGSTFFFNDIYHPTDQLAPTGYYTEIARALNFWQNTSLAPFSLHVEWNGGQFASNAWLFGIEYFLHNESYTNTFTFELMYKRISGQKDLNYFPVLARPFDKVSDIPIQFTFVWGMPGVGQHQAGHPLRASNLVQHRSALRLQPLDDWRRSGTGIQLCRRLARRWRLCKEQRLQRGPLRWYQMGFLS